jgi:hypothetical protein
MFLRRRYGSRATAAALLLASCAAGGPAPIAIHQSPSMAVWVAVDPRAGSGHPHPFPITPATMELVLRGVRCRERDTVTGTGLFGAEHGRPAFSQAESAVLATLLTTALKKASSNDLATFYMAAGGAVTSGGLYVEKPRLLHMMLANCRSVASGGQDYTSAMTLDSRDQPLLPITPYRFEVGFHPAEASVINERPATRPSFPAYGSVYTDPAKSIVIDLNRLTDEQASPLQPIP